MTLNVRKRRPLHSREALRIEIDTSLPAARVVRALDELIELRGKPKRLRLDNGPELISQALADWAQKNSIELCFIQPGTPTQNDSKKRVDFKSDIAFREDPEMRSWSYSAPALLFSAVAMLIAGFAHAGLQEMSFEYHEVFDVSADGADMEQRRGMALYLADQVAVAVNDIHVPAENCSSQEFDCVHSCIFSFAVPKLAMGARFEWNVDNQNYLLRAHQPRVVVFGKIFEDIYIIEGRAMPCASENGVSRGASLRRIFYFSAHKGLLGFLDLGIDQSSPTANLHLLAGKCGFAAPSSCFREDPEVTK